MNKAVIISFATIVSGTKIHDLDAGIQSLADDIDQESMSSLAQQDTEPASEGEPNQNGKIDPLYSFPDIYAPLPKNYEDTLKDPHYANTWQHTAHPNLGNQTAYENDAPAHLLEVVNSAD